MVPVARDWLRERLGYTCRDAALLEAALTHRSAAALNNERMEFLGDAVLSFVIAELLYRALPRAPEGDLSRLRASLVSGDTLAAVAALPADAAEPSAEHAARFQRVSELLEQVRAATHRNPVQAAQMSHGDIELF